MHSMCFFANTLFIMRYKGTRHVSIIKHFILILTQLHFEKYVKITLTTESMMPPQKIHFVRTLRRISKFIARLQMIDTQTLSQTQRHQDRYLTCYNILAKLYCYFIILSNLQYVDIPSIINASTSFSV